MNVSELLNRPGAWLDGSAKHQIAVSSRIRLARNLETETFPAWASDEHRRRIWQAVVERSEEMKTMDRFSAASLEELSSLDCQCLYERHLITREQIQRVQGSGVLVSDDESKTVMVNEEDHFRIQVLRSGLDLRRAMNMADRIDDEIEHYFPYAFSARWGYLTACPTNVGTGLRASVMLHLPGLVLMKEMNAVIKGINKIGLTVRGLWGEGSEAVGNMFQISNQVTLGESEKEIVDHLDQIVREVIEHEQNARSRLMEEHPSIVYDRVGRAQGILMGAHILSSNEALSLLSALRLGIDLELIDNIQREWIDELFIITQPAHLQKREDRQLNAEERDLMRAEFVRERLAKR